MADHALATVTNPAGALTDFSLLVDLATLPAAWWSAVTSSDGTKGRVYKGDGTTRLACDWIDFNSGASTGLLRVKWAGTLATSGTQQLWIEPPVSGNSSEGPTDTYGQNNAYDSSWIGYWPNGGGSDRTSNANDANPISAGNPTVGGATGKIGAGTDYDGSNDYCVVTNSATLDIAASGTTICAWAKHDNIGGGAWDAIIDRSNSSSQEGYHLIQRGTSDDASCISASGSSTIEARGGTISTTLKWYCGTADGSNAYIYENNSQVGTASGSLTPVNRNDDLWVGRDKYAAGTGYWDGVINEGQLHSGVRSSDWRGEEYAQSNSQSTFWGTWSWVSVGGGLSIPVAMHHYKQLMGVN